MENEQAKADTGWSHVLNLPFKLGAVSCTWDNQDMAGKVRLHRALHGDKPSLKLCIGKTIEVAHVATAPREDENDNGEIREWLEMILIAPNGSQYSTGSPHVADSIASALEMFGNPPWAQPLKFAVRSRTTSNKRDMLFLELLAEQSDNGQSAH